MSGVFASIDLAVVSFADEEGTEADINLLIGRGVPLADALSIKALAATVGERRFDPGFHWLIEEKHKQ